MTYVLASNFMSTYCGVNACLAKCLYSVLIVKALVGTFNQEKALVGAFFVIVKTDCETDGSFYSTNCDHHVVLPLPTLCLASEAKSPKSKSKIENKIFPCLCQKDTRGNLRLPIVFFSPSLWRLINCYAVFVGGFES